MKKLIPIITLALLVSMPMAMMAKSKSKTPDYTVEGLELIPDVEGLASVWAEPGADLSQFNRVMLSEPEVSFIRGWKRRHNDGYGTYITNADMNRMRASVSELFIEVFTAELQIAGYEVVSEPAEDVLLVKPEIIDLDVKAPAVLNAGINRTYTTTAGSMTLLMELRDSETNDLLAKAMDASVDNSTAGSQMAFRGGQQNEVAGVIMMKPWAEALVRGLDRSREVTAGASQ